MSSVMGKNELNEVPNMEIHLIIHSLIVKGGDIQVYRLEGLLTLVIFVKKIFYLQYFWKSLENLLLIWKK